MPYTLFNEFFAIFNELAKMRLIHTLALKEILTTCLFVSVLNGWAQEIPKSFSNAELDAWAKTYKDEDAIGHTLITEFVFKFNSASKAISVTETNDEFWIQLKDKSTRINRVVYYSGNSSVGKIKGKGGTTFSYHDKVKINEFFHHDIKVCNYGIGTDDRNKIHSISMEKEYSDSRYLTSVYFQTNYSVLNRIVRFKIPKYIDIELAEFNFDEYAIQKKTYSEDNLNVIEFTAKDLRKLPEDNNAPGISFHAPHVLVVSKSAAYFGQNYPIMGNTQEQYNWYKSLLKSAGNANEALKKTVKGITEGVDSKIEIIEAIFYWIQDNIRYIAFETGIAGFQPENCQNVLNYRYGDCKGMANLMTEMLKSAGIDGRMSWIGTNQIAYDYSVASLAVDNHAICTAIVDGAYYFLDGTEKFIGLGDYAERIQGRQVLIENGDNYMIKDVPSFDYKRNLEETNMRFTIDGLELRGNIKLQFNGESKVRLLSHYNTLFEEHQDLAKKYLIIRNDNNIHVNAIETSNLSKRSGELMIDGDVMVENKIFVFGNELFVDFDIYKEFIDLQIDTNRTLPYLFRSKIYMINETRIVTPDGYKIKNTPEDIFVKNEDFVIKVSYMHEKDGQEILIRKLIQVPKARIEYNNIREWNKAIKTLKEKTYEQQISYDKQ